MLKKPDIIQQVYNDGRAVFVELIQKVDDYGTPIRGEGEEEIHHEQWFRYLGITAQDVYYAHADDKNLSSKIALKGNVKINTKWRAGVNGKRHEIYRTYYNPKRNETELSLVEVADED